MIQAQLIDSIPKTSQQVILNILIQGEAIFAMVTIVYVCLICAWTNSYEKYSKTVIKLSKFSSLRLCRLIDGIAMAIFITSQLIFNVILYFAMLDI